MSQKLLPASPLQLLFLQVGASKSKINRCLHRISSDPTSPFFAPSIPVFSRFFSSDSPPPIRMWSSLLPGLLLLPSGTTWPVSPSIHLFLSERRLVKRAFDRFDNSGVFSFGAKRFDRYDEDSFGNEDYSHIFKRSADPFRFVALPAKKAFDRMDNSDFFGAKRKRSFDRIGGTEFGLMKRNAPEARGLPGTLLNSSFVPWFQSSWLTTSPNLSLPSDVPEMLNRCLAASRLWSPTTNKISPATPSSITDNVIRIRSLGPDLSSLHLVTAAIELFVISSPTDIPSIILWSASSLSWTHSWGVLFNSNICLSLRFALDSNKVWHCHENVARKSGHSAINTIGPMS